VLNDVEVHLASTVAEVLELALEPAVEVGARLVAA
jgi:hypothetical protein